MTTHKNRVLEAVTTVGAGAYTFGGAVLGYQTALDAGCVVGETYGYLVEALDANRALTGAFEVGDGVYALGGLTSTSVSDSSNGGLAVIWAAGSKRIALSATAQTLARLTPDLTQAPVSLAQAQALLLKVDKTFADATYQGINVSYSKAQSDERWVSFIGMAPAAMDTWTEMLAKMQLDDTGVAALVEVVAGKADKATSLSGYGIVDTYNSAQIDFKLNALSIAAGSTTWATLQGIPAVFQTPTSIVLTDDARLTNARAPTTHAHAITDVTGLQGVLDLKSPTTHGHIDATSTVSGFMPPASVIKLAAIAPNATANSTDTALQSRANHTGVQAISTVTGLQSVLDSKPTFTLVSGFIPSVLIQGGTDKIIETLNFAGLPAVGVAAHQYVTLDDNRTWRWGGTVYVETSASPGTTDSVTEGGVNLYFKPARVLTAVIAGVSLITGGLISVTDSVLGALGKLQKQVTDNLTSFTNHAGEGGSAHADATNSTSGFITGAEKINLAKLASFAGLVWEQGDFLFAGPGGVMTLLKKPTVAGQIVLYNSLTGIPYYASPIKGDPGAMPIIVAGAVTMLPAGSTAYFELIPTATGAIQNLFLPELGFSSNITLISPLEPWVDDYVTGAAGLINIDHGTCANWSWYADATADFQFNIRTSTLMALIAKIPESKSAVLVLSVKNGAIPFRMTNFTIDGVAPAISEWAAKSAPSSGTSNARDYYAITCKRMSGGRGWHVTKNMQDYG